MRKTLFFNVTQHLVQANGKGLATLHTPLGSWLGGGLAGHGCSNEEEEYRKSETRATKATKARSKVEGARISHLAFGVF